MGATRVVWDESFSAYDFGPGHPMAPVRLDLTARLAQSLGIFESVEVIAPQVATDDTIATVHGRDYIEAVKAASADPNAANPDFGLGTEDDPAFRGMHDASARIVEGTRQLCEDVWTGVAEHGVNFCGGLHHAMPGYASGFCVYNDIAVGIQWLLDHGVERVAYVDVDVHHGDGVEKIFWDDPRVLTASIHETGQALFPGTGYAAETGGPNAPGSALNVAMPPGTSDSAWLRGINSAILPVVRAFKPQVLVSQHGCDTHAEDPLAHMALSIDAQRYAMQSMHRLAHEITEGRWVALGGGGYSVIDVVPRSWTHLSAIAAHQPLPVETEVPQEWLEHVLTVLGRHGPRRMGDLPPEALPIWVQPWSMGYNPESATDRAIMATREATFAHHGLDVWFD